MGIAPDDGPVVIADYGSSQGKNSLAPMRLAIENVRRRVGPKRPISVFHIDQPCNDFNTLFEVLDADDPERYALNEPNVFPCAIGRSFYENVIPPDSVHLGWSSYAAVWLSRLPAPLSDHFVPLRGLEPLMDHANAALAEMVDEGTLRADDGQRMVLGCCCPRRQCELLTISEPQRGTLRPVLGSRRRMGRLRA